MKTSDRIVIVCVSDNFYAVLLGCLITSINANHISGEKVDLYIIDDGISRRNRKKLLECAGLNGRIKVNYLKLKEIIPNEIAFPKDASSFPINVYTRLLLPYFLPKDLKKAIYMDVDMIVEKDVSELWHTEIGGKPVAAVIDRSKVVGSSWAGIKNYRELGLAADTKYFNSGLLIMDLEQWRSRDFAAQVVRCVEENSEYVGFPDQYGLNVVLANQWHELDRRWNAYSTEDIPDPFLIHFVGVKPIFSNYDGNERYKKRFLHYLEQTPWKDFSGFGKYRWFVKKGMNKLNKFLKI